MTRAVRSAQGAALADTVDLIREIVPTIAPRTRWRYIPAGVPYAGSGPRAFSVDAIEHQPERYIAGAGSIEEHITVAYRCRYLPGDALDDMVGQDHVDWIEAIQPESTYPSGTWGAVRLRRVEAPSREPVDDETGELIVIRPVTLFYRYEVTL